jgi:hypothetical protein
MKYRHRDWDKVEIIVTRLRRGNLSKLARKTYLQMLKRWSVHADWVRLTTHVTNQFITRSERVGPQNFTWEHRFFYLGKMMPPDRMHQTDSGTTKQLIQRCLMLLTRHFSGMALSKKVEEFDRWVLL